MTLCVPEIPAQKMRHAFSLDIWKLSFGFFGIQFGWGLQMANMSRIYQYLGARESSIPLLWLAAPVTGLLVQPLIGHCSDHTWTGFGRRRPYILLGTILACVSLIAIPNVSKLWMAAALLWILDSAINVSMEPFRAFVCDLLPPAERKIGFTVQSVLIGFGAVLSSLLPWLLDHIFSLNSTSDGNTIPFVIRVSFYIGAFVYLAAVLYTLFTTVESAPADLDLFIQKRGENSGLRKSLKSICEGILSMPKLMRRLALVQFFSWFGLFCVWIYLAPAISHEYFGGVPGSSAFQRGTEWSGVCFAVFNGVGLLAALALVPLANRHSAVGLHRICMIAAGVGLLTVGVWPNAAYLLVSMVGVGAGCASVGSMPYALLANVIPPERTGFYMGVFNMFIVLPQIFAAAILGPVVQYVFHNRSILAVLTGGIAFLLAAVSLRSLREVDAGNQ